MASLGLIDVVYGSSGLSKKIEDLQLVEFFGTTFIIITGSLEDGDKKAHHVGYFGDFSQVTVTPVELDLTGLTQVTEEGVTDVRLTIDSGVCKLAYTKADVKYVQFCKISSKAPDPQPPGPDDPTGLSAGAIAGIVIACVVVVAAVVVLLYFLVFKKK